MREYTGNVEIPAREFSAVFHNDTVVAETTCRPEQGKPFGVLVYSRFSSKLSIKTKSETHGSGFLYCDKSYFEV